MWLPLPLLLLLASTVDPVTRTCMTNPLVPLVVHLKFTFPLARASLPTVLHALPHSLKVFWVLYPLASQFNAEIVNNLVMFEPSALILEPIWS